MKIRSLLLLALGFVSTGLFAQRTINGLVLDKSSNEPLPGVAVIVDGTAKGVFSGPDGAFAIQADPASDVLVFSFVGYTTLRVPLNGQTSLNAMMESGVALDEVVVTALGVSREKKALGYAVQELGNESFTQAKNDNVVRAYKEDVLAHLGKPLVDVRSPEEYSGERTHMPAYPEEGALRGGHIPSAVSVPWAKAANEDGTFKSLDELTALYRDEHGITGEEDVIAYCRIGERSSHTWFVLKYLMGIDNVRNYDGSWTEWGSAVRVPIVQGSEPGMVPA